MATTDQERSHSDEIREIWKLFRETDRKFEETDRMFKETDRKFEESAEQLKATQKMVNDLTGKWGKFVEGLVAPGAIRMFRERGVNIERTHQRVKAQKGGRIWRSTSCASTTRTFWPSRSKAPSASMM